MTQPDQTARVSAVKRIGLIALGAVLVLVVIGTGMAETANRNKQDGLAVQLFGASGDSWSKIAAALATEDAAQQSGEGAEKSSETAEQAREAADKALDYSLSHVRALRVYGLSEFAQGREEQGRQLLKLNAQLTWRDSITHAWLFEQELIAGDYDQAMDHADSLLRRGRQEPRIFEILTLAVLDDGLVQPIVDQFRKQANWRTRFFASAGRMAPAQYPGFRRLINTLEESDAPVTKQELLPFANALFEQGQAVQAVRDWQKFFPPSEDGQQNIAAWPQGDQLRRPYPTDWRVARGRNMRSQVLQDGRLQVNASEGARGEIAWRFLLPQSGSASIEVQGGENLVDLRFGAVCLPDGEKSYFTRESSNRWRAQLNTGCPIYRLTMDMPRGGIEEQKTLSIAAPTIKN